MAPPLQHDQAAQLVGMPPAEIRFPAFQNIEFTPFQGEALSISRDRIEDEARDQTHYEAEGQVFENSIVDNIEDRLVAGMGADVIVPTGERTALAYLLSPILKRLSVVCREECPPLP